MQKHRTLLTAVQAASKLSDTWILSDGECYFTKRDLLNEYAPKHDGSNPLGPGDYYVVSEEGAIGLIHKYEFTATWLLLPEKALTDFLEEMNRRASS